MIPGEFPIMGKVMHQTIYHPDPGDSYPKEVICLLQVRVSRDNWGGGEDDDCIMAIANDKTIEAAWDTHVSWRTERLRVCRRADAGVVIALF